MPAEMPIRYACCDKHLAEAMEAMTRHREEEALVIVRPIVRPDALMKCTCEHRATWFLRRVETERDRELAMQYVARDSKIVIGESSNHVLPKHDYEPGPYTSKMQTDPLCKVCSQPKKDPVHN